jgi:hypothetical protein
VKLFRCQCCDQVLYFENTRCERCGHRLGYRPDAAQLAALEPEGEGWRVANGDASYRFCANAAHDACNWLIPAESADTFCLACRHNRTVPDLSVPQNLALWRRIELAKHWLFYTLVRFGLTLPTLAEDAAHGLGFDFLADPPAESGPKVMTGHENGLITLAIVEADDVQREKRRLAMGEAYRTLLGHFRHEVGHRYWDVLVRDGGHLDEFRDLFGDDRQDYGAALQAHYARGAPADWQQRFVSAYASSHPWEDFAETWAHYLHIVDTLEMAGAFGVRVDPKVDRSGDLAGRVDFDPYQEASIEHLIEAWLPLTFALNSLNRCMGEPDLYPFVLSPGAIRKLGFIGKVIRAGLPQGQQQRG